MNGWSIYQLASSLTLSGASSINSTTYAKFQDDRDRLAPLRNQYSYPKRSDVWVEGQTDWINEKEDKISHQANDECIYLAGNSLGLMPKKTGDYIKEELSVWGKL